MESSSATKSPRSRAEATPDCKCSDGWICTITKTEPSKVGKPFSKCGGSCTCVTDASIEQTIESSTSAKVICKCGEGWSCVISKTEGPEAGKTYFECGEGCICVIDETNAVSVACV